MLISINFSFFSPLSLICTIRFPYPYPSLWCTNSHLRLYLDQNNHNEDVLLYYNIGMPSSPPPHSSRFESIANEALCKIYSFMFLCSLSLYLLRFYLISFYTHFIHSYLFITHINITYLLIAYLPITYYVTLFAQHVFTSRFLLVFFLFFFTNFIVFSYHRTSTHKATNQSTRLRRALTSP